MLLTEKKTRLKERNAAIIADFYAMQGMKGPKYAEIARKNNLKPITVQSIILKNINQ